MARPLKEGFDFYPFSSWITQDPKIKGLMRRHGAQVLAIYAELLAMVYRDKGYYLAVTPDTYEDVADSLYIRDVEAITAIVGEMLDAELFDRRLFKTYQILTSAGIQKRYLQMTKRRSANLIPARFVLIAETQVSDDKNPSYCIQKPGYCIQKPKKVSEAETGVSVTETVVSAYQNPGYGIPKPELLHTETTPYKSKENKNKYHATKSLSLNTEAEPQESNQSDPTHDNFPSEAPRINSEASSAQSSKNNQPGTRSDSRGNSGDFSDCAENDPVAAVINAWNERFDGTAGAFQDFYPSEMLKLQIQERLRVDDFQTVCRVFDYARREYDEDKANNRTFIWTLHAMFNKKTTFDRTKEKANRDDKRRLANQRTVRGYSNPETYASAEEWANFGKTQGEYATAH